MLKLFKFYLHNFATVLCDFVVSLGNIGKRRGKWQVVKKKEKLEIVGARILSDKKRWK